MTKVTTTIGELVEGQVLLVSARKVEGGKISLEFAEIIGNPEQSTNVLAVLNASDDRFGKNKRGARRVFLSVMPDEAFKYFGIKAEELNADGTPKELNILNPKLLGKTLRIQVKDSFKGDDYQMANPEKTAKQYTNNDGDKVYFTKDGKLIFSSTKLVDIEPKHSIITSDAQVSWEEYTASKVSISVLEALNAK